jgi:A/G-specific adenine glycosylase
VDANIGRVLARLFEIREAIDSEEGKSAVWEAAERLLPARGGRAHTSALMELGALICTARVPRCEACPVHNFCAAERPEMLPVKRPRRATVSLLEVCGWIRSLRGILLERQEGTRWKGLWKLPRLDPAPAGAEPLWEEVYPFTHHRVTLRVYAHPGPAKPARQQQWFRLKELGEVALAAAHRRAVEALHTGCKHL